MKNIFITYLVFSIFYLIFSNTLLDMGGNITTGMRKRLRYLMPPQLQSLIVRALVLSIPRTLNWKTGNKNKAPINQGLYHSGIFLSDIPSLKCAPGPAEAPHPPRTGEVGYCLSLG